MKEDLDGNDVALFQHYVLRALVASSLGKERRRLHIPG